MKRYIVLFWKSNNKYIRNPYLIFDGNMDWVSARQFKPKNSNFKYWFYPSEINALVYNEDPLSKKFQKLVKKYPCTVYYIDSNNHNKLKYVESIKFGKKGIVVSNEK